MSDVILKVPLGPETVLHGDEISAFFRHRYMIFLYLAAAMIGVIGTAGDGIDAPAEIRFTLATLEVGVGVLLMLALAKAQFVMARRRGVIARLHLGHHVLVGTLATIALAEYMDTWLLAQAPTAARLLALQVVFYGVLAQILFSVVLQFTLDRILCDLRSQGAGVPMWHDQRQGD